MVTPTGESFQAPAFRIKVVDTPGSGDVFDAGIIVAKLDGRSLREAARCGNTLASLSVAYEVAAQHLIARLWSGCFSLTNNIISFREGTS